MAAERGIENRTGIQTRTIEDTDTFNQRGELWASGRPERQAGYEAYDTIEGFTGN